MKLRGLKNVRCAEPEPGKSAAPKALAELMQKHWGLNARIFPGGIYPNVPVDLGKALVKAGAAEEIN